MGDTCHGMHYCLFFTSQALCRSLNRLAEEEFAPTGLAPSQTYLLMLVIDSPGITLKQLGLDMQLAPSTITRFIDSFVRKGLVTKASEGKLVHVTATKQGVGMEKTINQVWANLYQRYSDALGKDAADNLAIQIDSAVKSLES